MENNNKIEPGIISITVFLGVFFAIIISSYLLSDSTFWTILKKESGFAETISMVSVGLWEIGFWVITKVAISIKKWSIIKMILATREWRKFQEETNQKLIEREQKLSEREQKFNKEKEAFYKIRKSSQGEFKNS